MNRCVKMAPEVDPATRLEGFSQSDIPVNQASRKALEQVDQMENGKLFGTQQANPRLHHLSRFKGPAAYKWGTKKSMLS